jgi:hypothetical protein
MLLHPKKLRDWPDPICASLDRRIYRTMQNRDWKQKSAACYTQKHSACRSRDALQRAEDREERGAEVSPPRVRRRHSPRAPHLSLLAAVLDKLPLR